ncbi:MAG TPA: hypothetical protein VHU15_09345 [Stellaceae bacterium]|jgi:hypothetical protein|nr:hypothetical protein [Stellaceae bacterium]
MTDHVWHQLRCVEDEIGALQNQIGAAERERNFGQTRILAERIRTAELARERVLCRLGGALSAAA